MTQGKLIAFGAGAVSTLLLKNEKAKRAVDRISVLAAKGASKVLDGIEALSNSESAKSIREKAKPAVKKIEVKKSVTQSASSKKTSASKGSSAPQDANA